MGSATVTKASSHLPNHIATSVLCSKMSKASAKGNEPDWASMASDAIPASAPFS